MTTGDERAQEIKAALDAMSDVTREALEYTDDDDTAFEWLPIGITSNAYRWLRDLLTERSKKVEQIARLRLIIQCLEAKMDMQSRASAMLAYEAALKVLEGQGE